MNDHDLVDPRALPLDDRAAARRRHDAEQRHWLERLRRLAELPLADDFPAFLLGTAAFADLARRIGAAEARAELATEVADELDWFVDRFATYLRTCDGEDSFAGSALDRRA